MPARWTCTASTPTDCCSGSSRERLVDVAFGGRRIWSFWVVRDGEQRDDGIHLVWPKPLRPFLDGVAEVTITDPGNDAVLFSQTVQFGARPDRIDVVNPSGRPLAIDKSLKLVETFDTRDAAHVEPLLDAIAEVLGALKEVGLDAFLAYGTALGAIRDGGLIGHDSDADLGYVSTYDHPVDVIRESFRIQRALTDMGYRVTRYSAIALKVHVRESDGLDRGLDVFGGFMRDGTLYLMGEIAVPFGRDWIFPLGTGVAGGTRVPGAGQHRQVPHRDLRADWRVPDPAYKFTTPASTIDAASTAGSAGCAPAAPGGTATTSAPSTSSRRSPTVAREVVERHPDLATYVDIGCGRGADVAWLRRPRHPRHRPGLPALRLRGRGGARVPTTRG